MFEGLSHLPTGDKMKYMLLIYTDENAWTADEREQCYAESTELTHELNSRGQYLGANPLQPVATATSVRVRDGKRLVTDGPFAETREQLGGYFLVEAKDLNEAIAIADANSRRPQGHRRGPAGHGACGPADACANAKACISARASV